VNVALVVFDTKHKLKFKFYNTKPLIMKDIIKKIRWKGPPFSVTIQNNEKDGKYVFTDAQKKYILKLEDMDLNDEGSENEKKVLSELLRKPKENLPRPLQFDKIDNINVSIMVNSGISLDGKTFKNFFKELPTANDFVSAVDSLVTAVENLHGMGYIHRDITPGNVVYHRRTNKWTLIDFDFTVPFDYPEMGSEVIVNPNYDYVVHPWFKLDQNDYMYFDVPKLKEYIGSYQTPWYMFVDYYATAKVLLYTFGLLLDNDDTYEAIIKDETAFDLIVNGQFKNTSKKLKSLVKLLMSLVAGFSNRQVDMHATKVWVKLVGHKASSRSKRMRNDTGDIKGNVGRLKRSRKSAKTFELIK
jgi:serine/threonine protein kinase